MSRRDGDKQAHKKPAPPSFETGRIHTSDEARRRQSGGLIGVGGNVPPTEAWLIAYGKRRINDKDTDPRLKLRYWERIGEYLHLWGPKADSRKPQQPVEFPIDEAATPSAIDKAPDA